MRPSGRFRASKAAQSRRGEAGICFPPDPLLFLCYLRERLLCLAALVAEKRLNFRLTRKRSSAKAPLVLFVCCAAAAGSWKSNFTFPVYGEGGRAPARSDEAVPRTKNPPAIMQEDFYSAEQFLHLIQAACRRTQHAMESAAFSWT